VKEELGSLEDQSDRFRYLFARLLRSVYAVVENAAQELRCSKFKPISFELGFGNSEDAALPPVELTVDGVTIAVSGFVDRVDGWIKDDRLCLRVVDYKTGRKSFDLTEIWNGLGLQMLLYLFTLQEKGEKLYHMPVDSVGVLYMPARDAVIQAERTVTDEQLKKQLDKTLVRSGLVLDDPEILAAMEEAGEDGFRFLPLKVSKKDGKISGEALATAEQFGKLAKHIQTVLEEICRELARGDITADPYWRGPDKNACRYCEYAAACQFEEGRRGDCRRWMPTVKASQFWENISQPQSESE
jgi:ATP-dependent helicase/nuclease subunit B